MITSGLTVDPAQLRAQLRSAGLRVTSPRLSVLAALAELPHSDADTVFRSVAKQLPTTSIQAVYNVLGALTDAGILRRIEPAGSSALYERRTDDNHHHLICSSCRIVIDIDCAIGEAPCLQPSQTHGFALTEAEVTFWGLCPSCQSGQQHTPTEGE